MVRSISKLALTAAIAIAPVVPVLSIGGCEDDDRPAPTYTERPYTTVEPGPSAQVYYYQPGYYYDEGYYDSYRYWHPRQYYYYDGRNWDRRDAVPRGYIAHERHERMEREEHREHEREEHEDHDR